MAGASDDHDANVRYCCTCADETDATCSAVAATVVVAVAVVAAADADTVRGAMNDS
jgi:hypothetical protein